MSIEIRPSGEAQAYAGAGRVIGKAKAREIAREEAQRAQELALEEAQRAQELAFRQRAQQMSNDWELQKMLLNSQLDFQHEQRMVQIEQEKFEKAKAWDVEKMELASHIDFQREEQDRQRKLSVIDSEEEAFDKYCRENPGEAEQPWAKAKKFEFGNRRIEIKTGGTFTPPVSQFQTGKESPLEQYFKQRSEGGLGTPEPPVENVYVKFPDGQILSVSITKVMPNGLTELQEALINDKGVILPGQNIPSQESPIQEKPMRETPSFIRPPTFPGWLPSNRRQ